MVIPMTRDHLGPCVELYVETFNAPPWNESWTTEDAQQRLHDFLATPRAHGACLVDHHGTLLGFALGHLERFCGEDHFLLKEMCVRAGSQRRGHGTRLLDALAQDLGAVEHWFLLTARETPAAAFYESAGFRPAARLGVFVRP